MVEKDLKLVYGALSVTCIGYNRRVAIQGAMMGKLLEIST